MGHSSLRPSISSAGVQRSARASLTILRSDTLRLPRSILPTWCGAARQFGKSLLREAAGAAYPRQACAKGAPWIRHVRSVAHDTVAPTDYSLIRICRPVGRY